MKLLRILRPFFHFIIILFVFFLTYKIRLEGDTFRDVPFINIKELEYFAIFSALIFLARGRIKNLYQLTTLSEATIKILSKVRGYRFISMTFISYFGQGFIFMRGISRFVIISAGILSFVLLFLFDQLRHFIDFKIQQKAGKKILIVSNNLLDNSEIIHTIKQNFSFPTEFIQYQDIESIELEKYAITVAMGTFERHDLQDLFDKVRFHPTRFFHISEGYFLEDVVYIPEKLDSIIAMEYKHSKLDGRALVIKRLCDIIGSIFGIIIGAIPMIIIAIAIKIDSPGSVIYSSKRVGKG